MEKFDVVIVGGGLGGLLCGNILSREGKKVCIIEKNEKLGGCIQSFSKNKSIFNTGLNYTESLAEGEVLYKYFKYFQIIDKIKIRQLDIDAFEKISFASDTTEYPYAQGHDNFVEKLCQYFPKEKANLNKYITNLERVCNCFPFYNLDNSNSIKIDEKDLSTSVYQYLNFTTQDAKLQQVLGGLNSLYAGVKEKTPLYVHALINYSFIKSSWRFVDGSSQLAERIADVVRANGGVIMRSAEVKSFDGSTNNIDHVKLTDGQYIYADTYISNLHPSTTFNMINADLSKKAYKIRINSLQNTMGMFSLYIVLKKNKFQYLNFNHHYFSDWNVWTNDYNEKCWPEHYMLYTPAISASSQFATGIVALTYMKYDEVKKWENSYINMRGEEYLDFKRRKAEKLIDLISLKFPNLREQIETYYTATPLSYRDYTGTPDGSSYGILKDFNNPYATIITPKTKFSNLFLTGQNLNMHGILGVSISAALTSAEIIGREYLFKKLCDI